MLYSIEGKNRPSVYDEGTEYSMKRHCSRCAGIHVITRLGAYLPTWHKPFGLIKAYGGIIAAAEAVEFLRKSGIVEFVPREAFVASGPEHMRRAGRYFELYPTVEIELDTDRGSGPVAVCEECGRTDWRDKDLALPRFKEVPTVPFFRIKYSLIYIADDSFVKASGKVPGGSYLDFQEWKDQDSSDEIST